MDDEEKKEEDEKDQYLSAVGNIGQWQLRTIFILGLFCTPVSMHILIMTFMNAKVESWCARPAHLSSLNLSTWRTVSGQVNQSCQIINTTWTLFSLTGKLDY
ncbi:uncharacterized protein LOC111697337 [Eurytemora carolleeae]|uniref:uncharacterized protein LOC111697337 n=1 Tax=Eurytemora carolleeae TaxID=1294199 RepID=UPI000C77E13A|nr:uncharacterized protein LOC111697337 [Eurytemora carolleeae]|eukprot:XP_023323073.1 uncharacterized protein LOC111697337 [Eurytemora affinis]